MSAPLARVEDLSGDLADHLFRAVGIRAGHHDVGGVFIELPQVDGVEDSVASRRTHGAGPASILVDH